jgi:hypothetical protein
MTPKFEVPILFQFYNRGDTSLIVFNTIKEIKPNQLYLVQDGYRRNETKAENEYQNLRHRILNQIDWECRLVTYFREDNMGPGAGTADALKWFFNQVEYGIVLEHDCLPHPDFFEFCKVLLDKYKDENQVMLINGSNFQNGGTYGRGSYYFGVSAQLWGWAAWKRTFDKYDYNIENYDPNVVLKDIKSVFKTRYEQKYWTNIFHQIRNRKVDTWDYQILFNIWHERGLILMPNRNLISNIGFGDQSLNCKDFNSPFSDAGTFPIFPLKYVDKIKRNYKSDRNYLCNYLAPFKSDIHFLKSKVIDYSPDCIYEAYKYIKKLI